MKKLLTILVVLALVVWIGFKAAVWYLADSRLAMAREGLSEQGVLLRGEIGSSIAGVLSLRDAHFQPFQLTQGVDARLLEFRTPSGLALLQSLLDPARLPGQWSLKADGLRLVLDPAMIKNWVAPDPDAPPALFAPVCGPDRRQRLGSGDLVRMGVTEITGDGLLRQGPDALHFELNTSAIGSLELDWPGARLDPTRLTDLPESTQQAMTVILRDGGFMRKLAAFCARESGLAIDAWAATVAEDFNAALAARDLGASPQLRALYVRYLTEGGQLEISLRPSAPALGIPVRAEGGDSDADMVVEYNEARVPGVYLTPITPEAPEVPEQAREPVVAEAVEPGPDWRPSSPAEAARWIDRRVRVTLESGRVVEGRLTSVSETGLTVAQVMDGGEVAYPTVKTAITKFEVWRRASDQGRPLPPAPEPESTPAGEEPLAGETGTNAEGEPEN